MLFHPELEQTQFAQDAKVLYLLFPLGIGKIEIIFRA